MLYCHLHLWRVSEKCFKYHSEHPLTNSLIPFLDFISGNFPTPSLRFQKEQVPRNLLIRIYQLHVKGYMLLTVLLLSAEQCLPSVFPYFNLFVHVFCVHIFEVIPSVDSGCLRRVSRIPQLKFFLRPSMSTSL